MNPQRHFAMRTVRVFYCQNMTQKKHFSHRTPTVPEQIALLKKRWLSVVLHKNGVLLHL